MINSTFRTTRSRLEASAIVLIAALIAFITLLVCRDSTLRFLPLSLDVSQQVDLKPYVHPDSGDYISIARGGIADVHSPYSRRVLYPLMIRGIAENLHLSLGSAFILGSISSFFVFAFCLTRLFQIFQVSVWWVLVVLLMPSTLEALSRIFLLDLFYMALLCVFFLLLAEKREKAALVVLMLAFLARENTSVLCVVVCGVGYIFQRRLLVWGGLLVLVAGVLCDGYFVRQGLPNYHHMPEFIYALLEIPCSFMANVFGLVVWTNTNTPEGIPFWHCVLPHFLQIGADREIFAAYIWRRNFEAFCALVTVFGCFPLILWLLRKNYPPVREWSVALAVAFSYGLICYFLGVSVGRTGTFRLIAYAWPLFWVAMPWLFSRSRLKANRWEAWVLVAISMMIAWIPDMTGFTGAFRIISAWLLIIPIVYVCTAVWIVSIRRRTHPRPTPRSAD